MEFVLLWLVINAVVGALIGQRNNDIPGSIIVSILLGPIGWLVALLSKGSLRKCPFCAEHIKPEAKVCRHCGREVPSTAKKAAPISPHEAPSNSKSQNYNVLIAIFLTAILGIIAMGLISHFVSKNRKKTLGASGDVPQLSRTESADGALSIHAIDSPVPAQQAAPQQLPPQEIAYPTLKLTKPFQIKDSLGNVIGTLSPGQVLQYVSRDNYVAVVRLSGSDFEIPISSTNLK